MARDTSRDGFGNELQTYVLTHFGGLWRLLQRSRAAFARDQQNADQQRHLQDPDPARSRSA